MVKRPLVKPDHTGGGQANQRLGRARP